MRRVLARASVIGLIASAVGLFTTTAYGQDPEPAPPQEAPRITTVQRQRPWTGLAIGLGAEKVITTNGDLSNPLPFRFLFRTPAQSGWAISPMMGWFGSDVDADVFGHPGSRLGKLSVRPVLVGVRRTWVGKELSYDVALAAGPSFNGFKLAAGASPLAGLGSTIVSTDANVSFAWRVQGTAWRDITDKVALRASVAYAWNRPEITFTSGSSNRRVTQNANSIQIAVGAAYRIF